MTTKEQTRQQRQKRVDAGLVQINPWVPKRDKEATLAYCAELRQKFLKEKIDK